MKHTTLTATVRFSAFLLFFLVLCAGFAMGAVTFVAPEPAEKTVETSMVVVLDPGHGGEDGGAIGEAGSLEKDLNLALSLLIREELEARGATVVMTRESDMLLYDHEGEHQGQKKRQDLAARVKIAEETPGSLVVSIHMNTYPRADCQGLQVWYSQNNPDSRVLAEAIQAGVRAKLQPQNHRTIKAAGSSIGLLSRLHQPAVLVECGFLSSPEEEARLTDPDYQRELAVCIAEAVLSREKSAE